MPVETRNSYKLTMTKTCFLLVCYVHPTSPCVLGVQLKLKFKTFSSIGFGLWSTNIIKFHLNAALRKIVSIKYFSHLHFLFIGHSSLINQFNKFNIKQIYSKLALKWFGSLSNAIEIDSINIRC